MAKADPAIEPARAEEGNAASSGLWQKVWLAAGVILLATWAAYANSFWVPFIFDDLQTITLNPSIRHLWPLGPVLSPPPGGGTSGRPLANLSLACNHAWGGDAVMGYHAVNLAIHVLAALVLLGLVRRTLLRPALRDRWGDAALPLAAAVALLWALHPLQTEAVTYISQRTESLMGLCYLLTLYGFIRGMESSTPKRWLGLSIGACLLGALAKEVIVTAPVLVLLYDRTFVAGTFREAWRRRWRYYAGLAASWILLAWLMRGLTTRHVGYGLGVSAWTYALTESWAIVHYLRLAIWPHPLVFDYGLDMVTFSAAALANLLLMGLLVAATCWALWKRPALGFVAAAIFILLAPASSIVPVVMQPVAEHRMYLPLAGVVVLAVMGLQAAIGRWAIEAVLVLAALLGVFTAQRNAVYFSEVTLWGDTVSWRPDNARAQTNLGSALVRDGRLAEAREHFAAAVRLHPDDAEAHYNLANVLLQLDRPAEAVQECTLALRLKPDFVEAHCIMGSALAHDGRINEAVVHFQAAVRIDPASVGANYDLGQALFELGNYSAAAEQFATVVRLQPDFAEAHQRLGDMLARLNRPDEARAHYAEARRLSSAPAPVAEPGH